MEFGKAIPYDIKITRSDNKGFIVKAGCCIAVFANRDTLLKALEEYLNDPEKMENDYNEANGTTPEETEANRDEPQPERSNRVVGPPSERLDPVVEERRNRNWDQGEAEAPDQRLVERGETSG